MSVSIKNILLLNASSNSSTRCLLWIGVFSNHIHDYCEGIAHSYHFPLKEATMFLTDDTEKVDGIIMTMLHKPSEISSVKEIAFQKNIPIFLYTVTFEQYAKDLTLQLGVDEYIYG